MIFLAGLLTHGDLDERALDALKEFPADGGVAVLKEFKEQNPECKFSLRILNCEWPQNVVTPTSRDMNLNDFPIHIYGPCSKIQIRCTILQIGKMLHQFSSKSMNHLTVKSDII